MEIFQKSEHLIFAVFLTVVNILPLGMSILQKKEDIFADCRKKFWNTYKVRQAIWMKYSKYSFLQQPFSYFVIWLCVGSWSTSSHLKSGQAAAGTAARWVEWCRLKMYNVYVQNTCLCLNENPAVQPWLRLYYILSKEVPIHNCLGSNTVDSTFVKTC